MVLWPISERGLEISLTPPRGTTKHSHVFMHRSVCLSMFLKFEITQSFFEHFEDLSNINKFNGRCYPRCINRLIYI